MSLETEHHSTLNPLSWLFGVWESVEAEAHYPTMETLQYTEILEFKATANALNALEYNSAAWHGVKKCKMHCESGFIRVDPESGKVALVVSHNFGLSEVSEGTVEKEELKLESKLLSEASFNKCPATVKIIRQLMLKGDELHSTVLMQTANTPLQNHLESRYRRKV